MKDKEKRITINREAGAMVDLLNNEIEELQKASAIEEGYRKIPEDSVVLSREEYEKGIIERESMRKQINELFNDREQARKETAEKIYTKIKDSFLMNSNNRYALKLWIEEQFGLEIKE